MNNDLRILSLLPAATEMVYLLGLEKYLVGVSSDCDYPPQVKRILKVTSSIISNAMSSLQIDQAVKSLVHRGSGVFHIDQEKLKKLKPNLILTQELCEVCAVGFNQVKKAARILDGEVKIVSLEPESMEDILSNIRVVGEFGGKEKEAVRVVRELRERIEKISSRIHSNNKPKVCVVEWLDPLMVAGHWVPEMVEVVGGINLVTRKGERSNNLIMKQLQQLNPDILIISPCGFDIQRTLKERKLIVRVLREFGAVRGGVYLVDGNSYMTRPGQGLLME